MVLDVSQAIITYLAVQILNSVSVETYSVWGLLAGQTNPSLQI